MAATVLFPAAPCHRATASAASTAAGALRHCGLLPPPARRRRGSRGVSAAAAAPPERSSVPLAAASGHGSSDDDDDAKAALYRALEGVNRGIFGMTSAQRSEIHGLVELLESRNPTPEPTAELQDKVDGCWKLIYSTISILGKKRTQLGLRDFITLGDFLQIIDVKERVDIKLENSTITPEQLMNLFQKNYDMLLAIFNPEGWLEIT
nr:unnamed protein product [Digitaria exilis]